MNRTTAREAALLKSSKVAFLAVAIGTVVILTSCSSDANAGASVDYGDRKVVTGAARLDAQTDSATMPLDRYSISTAEDQIVDYAIDIDLNACMAKDGQTFTVIDRTKSADTTGWRLFGVWILDKAAKYGYELPPPDAVGKELARLNSAPRSAANDASYQRCLPLAQKKFPRTDQTEMLAVEGEAEAYGQTMQNDKDAAKLLDSWRKCMSSAGVTAGTKNDPLAVDTAKLSKEQQIKVAVLDVQCKQKNDLVQRLADIDASYQMVFIQQKQAALNEERSKIEKTQEIAQAFIADHA